jgi:hypothetical protein
MLHADAYFKWFKVCRRTLTPDSQSPKHLNIILARAWPSRCIHSVAYPSSVDITVVQCAQVLTDPVNCEKEDFTYAIGENAVRYTIPTLSLRDDRMERYADPGLARTHGHPDCTHWGSFLTPHTKLIYSVAGKSLIFPVLLL